MTDADIVCCERKSVGHIPAITPIFPRFGLLLSALDADRDKDVCGLCLGKKHQRSVATATHCRDVSNRHHLLLSKRCQLVINRISVKDILFSFLLVIDIGLKVVNRVCHFVTCAIKVYVDVADSFKMVPALTEETYHKKWKHYPECKYKCDHKHQHWNVYHGLAFAFYYECAVHTLL